jgi:16S rRNA C967 or C1407 C5-methylase (RsmB/RsmF family)
MAKNKVSGAELFQDYYQSVYGERWPLLKEALKEQPRHILLANPYSQYKPNETMWKPHAYFHDEKKEAPSDGPLAPYYFMDGASYLAPFYLDPKPGESVLDLCAAPGGKSLVLAYLMNCQGHLTVNDKSTDRRFRLQRVMRQYLPQEFTQESLRVTGFDASGWCLFEQEAYDKILLDAPCSSERHVLASEKHLSEWTLKRSKRLAALQWKMLASSWLVLKKGGRLVYSTCSLSPMENDDVVAKLVKKYEVKVVKPKDCLGEETKHGHLILPDDDQKFGPFYVSVLEKPVS